MPPNPDPNSANPSPRPADNKAEGRADGKVDSQVDSRKGHKRPFPWFWFGTFIGTLLGGLGLGLAAWAWIFINEDLSPLLSKTLSEELERSVEIGDVESITLNSIQVGPSQIGASKTDPTRLTAETIVVNVNPIEALFTSRLNLDIVVEEANGYLQQDPKKGWLNVDIPEQDNNNRDNNFKVRLARLRLRDSFLTMVPVSQTGDLLESIPVENLSGQLNVDPIIVDGEEAQRFRFELSGNPIRGGDLSLKGEVQPLPQTKVTAADANDEFNDLDNAADGASDDLNNAQDKSENAIATNLLVTATDTPVADVLRFTLASIAIPTDTVDIKSGIVSGSVDLGFRPNKPVDYSGTLSVEKASLTTQAIPLPIENISGKTQFQGNQWTIDRLKASYGEIDAIAQGLLDFDNGYALDVKTQNVTVEEFVATTGLKLPVPVAGNFNGTAQISGPINSPLVAGSAVATELLTVDKVAFTTAGANLLYKDRTLYIDDIAATPTTGGSLRGSGQVRFTAGSPFAFDLTGRSLPAREIAQLYNVNPNFQIGLVSADVAVVSNNGNLTTNIRWNAPAAQYPASGIIDINGRTLAFRNTKVAVGGGLVTGTGTLVNDQWQANVNIDSVDLGSFSTAVNGDINGQLGLSGSTQNASLNAIAAQGNLTFANGLAAFSSPQNTFFQDFTAPLSAQVAWNGQTLNVINASSDRLTASGTLTPSFANGFALEQFDLALNAQDYALSELPFDIPEQLALAGRGTFNGRVTGSPSAPNASGNIQLANLAVNLLPFESSLAGTLNYTTSSGLDLDVSGTRDKIALNLGPFQNSPSLNAGAGTIPPIAFDVNWRDAFATGQTQGDILNVQASNFPLAFLNFPPGNLSDIGQLRGTLSTNAAINLNNQTLAGNFTVDQLGLGYINIGRIGGQVRYADSIATLAGGQLVFNENLYDVSGTLSLAGSQPSYSLNAATSSGNIQNILSALSIYRLEDFRRGLTPPAWANANLSKTELDAILATRATGRPEAAVLEQLRRLAELQALEAESVLEAESEPLPPLKELDGPFAGNIQLNGTGGDFKVDFDIAGNNWTWGDDYSAQDVVARGSLTPNVLTLEPVRLASTVAKPPRAAIATDLPAETGQPETSDTPKATGELTGESTNEPTGEPEIAAVTLAGQLVFGRDTELTSSLQANAQNLEVGLLRDIFEIPIDIEGFANATANLGGTLANPQLRGEASLETASINGTPIETADAQFIYQNARLKLESKLIATAPDNPLMLVAQIPYAFNFMDTQPQTSDIDIKINVADEGLALLNIFNDQVAWESGEGEVSLNVGGTLSNPEIQGFATLQNAVLSARILPDLLTDVNAQAKFVGDRIIVETLEGNFSEGKLTAAGTFPLLNPIATGVDISALSLPANNPGTPAAENAEVDFPENFNPLFPQPLSPERPLTFNFEDIDLNLENLYEGGVYGQIVVGGSALLRGPQIGGEVILSNGQISLPDGSGNSSVDDTVAGVSPENPIPISLNNATGIVPAFRNLRLTLGDSVRITQGNLLNFVADGTLALNGSPQDLEPEGTINLRSGRVNLYTTVFRLRGRDNTAVFTPETGISNPFLDVSLRATVPEVNTNTGPLTASPFDNGEVADTSVGFETTGSLRTIRVRADVVGPANTIFENLELSSSPSRSEDELIALIGGGFINALESTVGSLSGSNNGDGFQGLINLVGGALLNNVQDAIGNALSVSELRLFPVTSANRSNAEANEDNGIDFGAEVGFDITDSTTFSILKVLTDSTNPEFGINYRLTDELNVRGTTNFEDVNQVLLEYELRF